MKLLAILTLVNFILGFVMAAEVWFQVDSPPIFFQTYLFNKLDEHKINLVGQILVYVLTAPFTIGYSILTSGAYFGICVCVSFLWLFKRGK